MYNPIEEMEFTIDNVRFCNRVEEGEAIIMDKECPKSIVWNVWLQRYVNRYGLKMEDVEKKASEQTFRFGPDGIY